MRIGVLGGTFDPVHFGHLLLAEAAADAAALDTVLFMPAHIQPFKQAARMAGDGERMEMLKLAIAGNGKFDVTDVELSRGGVSYTIDSLRRLRDGTAVARWFFIVGADMFLSLEKWKEHDALMKEFGFIVGVRPGHEKAEIGAAAERYRERYGTEIAIAQNTWLDVSSTEIRRRIAEGGSVRYMTPDAVVAYIEARGLYGYE